MNFCEVKFYDENHNNVIERVMFPETNEIELRKAINEHAKQYLESGEYKTVNWSLWKEVSTGTVSK